jgi:hypothetical protein
MAEQFSIVCSWRQISASKIDLTSAEVAAAELLDRAHIVGAKPPFYRQKSRNGAALSCV